MQQLGRLCAYVILVGGLWVTACSDKGTQSTPVSFSLRVQVTDSIGYPVNGLRVDAWNAFSPPLTPPLKLAQPEPAATIPVPTEFRLFPVYPNPFVGSMSTRFDLPVACSYDFRVTDLTGREVFFFSGTSVPAGTHNVVLGPSVAELTAYVIEVVAYDSNRVFFADTTFGASWSPQPSRNTIGRTEGNGELITRDSLRFPSLFSVPEMTLTDPGGSELGTFEYVDSVWIMLSDTNGLKQSFVQSVSWGKNVVKLVWQP